MPPEIACVDESPPDEVRTPQGVARRSLALFGVWGLTIGVPREQVLAWLDESGLHAELTPNERTFIANPRPAPKQLIDVGWHAERLIVLLWALGLVDNLPAADEKCDVRIFRDRLPPFTDESVEKFVQEARLRSDDQLSRESDRIYDLHCEAVDARRHGRLSRERVDIHVIHQRHHAISWIMGYRGQDWDVVTPDT